jgi:two-component system sensor histidine kinase CiaH
MAKRQGGMFHSARLKLTFFYLITILVLSLSASAGIRIFAEQEYLRSNAAQRGEVYHLSKLYLFSKKPPQRPESMFSSLQEDQAALVRQHLNQALVIINLAALFVGGVLSYWYAGRTLRPIEEAHEAQKRFASDASHELRTPLTNMQVENEVFLRQKHFSEDEARAQLESNLEEVQRLEKLSTNLLALTQYGQAALLVTKIPADRLVNAALKHVQKTAKAKKVTFKQDIKAIGISGHEESLAQLLDILLDNAIKYGPEGGTVTVTGRSRSGLYALRIADEGPGILPTDMPHIFDRLYRGDKARGSRAGGYGLGLALAKQIAAANSTTIKVESKPGKGAVFEMQLPLAK